MLPENRFLRIFANRNDFDFHCDPSSGHYSKCMKKQGGLYSKGVSTMKTQEEVLLTLVQGQEGRAWALDKTGWKKQGAHDYLSVCKWDYITCGSYETNVVGIDMNEADFVGTLPPELGDLLTIKEISMTRNLIVGTLPQKIANLPHLEKLFLAENRLTGTIPNFVSRNLKTLDLQNNLFSGTLPLGFLTLNPQLTQLDLGANKLKGHLPPFVPPSKFNKLISLSLSDNEFSGTIHSSLGEISSISFLYLNDNKLMGTIPTEFSGTLSNLQECWLENNLLTGTIPAAIGEMPSLFNFYIDGNKLTGFVPESLCREEMNEDFFEGINGDRNFCESIACPPGTVSYEGVYPCDECQKSFFNPYLGRADKCIDLLEFDIIKSFYTETQGNLWMNMEKPWEMRNKDYCTYEGITCGNNGNVIAIELKGKGLRGTVPEEIGFLQFLERLDLSNNYLTGFLPSDLRWSPLQLLDVSENRIQGIIPHALCKKEGINSNGLNGKYDCDLIQCSPGTYTPTGRAKIDSPKCTSCPEGKNTPYIGSTSCHRLFHKSLASYLEDERAIIPSLVLMILCFGCYFGCLGQFLQLGRLMAKSEENNTEDEGDEKQNLRRYLDNPEEQENDDDEESEEEDSEEEEDGKKADQNLITFNIDDDDEEDEYEEESVEDVCEEDGKNLISLDLEDNNDDMARNTTQRNESYIYIDSNAEMNVSQDTPTSNLTEFTSAAGSDTLAQDQIQIRDLSNQKSARSVT